MLTSNPSPGNLTNSSTTPRPGAAVTPASPTAATRATNAVARNVSFLGSTMEIKGQISGDEDLQIDGRVQGPISLQGKRLIAGRTAQLDSEIVAAEVIVYGKVTGNLLADDRIEIKKDASVIGDITSQRVMIEDGAHFKGSVEIDRGKSTAGVEAESLRAPATVGSI
jgi:cytoskeletal protein CcmA (bactofilin family)